MADDQIHDAAHQLAHYIKGLADFSVVVREGPYHHMGATIADSLLQSGMRYERQVLPRVNRILREYPQATTSSRFQQVLATHTPEATLKLRGRKTRWVQLLTDFLVTCRVETEDDLQTWLGQIENRQRLLQQHGVGPKTLNYLCLLVGITSSVAVDTHIRAFVRSAGIDVRRDDHIGQIVGQTATLLGFTPGQLDASIWSYRAKPSAQQTRYSKPVQAQAE